MIPTTNVKGKNITNYGSLTEWKMVNIKKQENKVTLTEKLRLIATRLEFNATH